jgi:hypothetical protein
LPLAEAARPLRLYNPFVEYTLSEHAHSALSERGISLAALEAVLREPQQRFQGRSELWVYQSLEDGPDGRTYVLRLLVEERGPSRHVVTVYRSSKVSKYWRENADHIR